MNTIINLFMFILPIYYDINKLFNKYNLFSNSSSIFEYNMLERKLIK